MTTKKEVYAAYGIERRPAALESALSELKAKDAEIARLQAQVAELQALSVTHIMIDVAPGEDGIGEEIFARSVADVNGLISALSEQASEADTLQAQVDALAAALQAMLEGSFCIESARIALAAIGR